MQSFCIHEQAITPTDLWGDRVTTFRAGFPMSDKSDGKVLLSFSFLGFLGKVVPLTPSRKFTECGHLNGDIRSSRRAKSFTARYLSE